MVKDHRNITRIQNKKLVLQQLFNNPETSRAEIARQLNLNKSTVSSIYTELKGDGFTHELRQGESTSSGGRKPDMICLNRNYGFVASFNIGTTYMASMFNYVNGEIIQYNRQPIKEFDILNIMQMIETNIKQMEDLNNTVHGLLAIGFSIHGVVNDNQVVDSPFLKLNGIDLEEYFRNEFKVPVLLENEANLSAVFENDYNVSTRIKDLIVISVHRGIGAGVIANHSLYHGYRGLAGEIGRTMIANNDPGSSSRKLVKVESLCSEDAIINQVKKAKALSTISPQQLLDLYQSDDEVRAIFDRDIKLLAEVTYNSIVAYGPERVYFNATLFEDIPKEFKKLKHYLVEMGITVPIQMIKGSRMTSLFGIASLAIRRALGLDHYQLKFRWPREVQNVD